MRLGQAQWDRHGETGAGTVGQGQHGESGRGTVGQGQIGRDRHGVTGTSTVGQGRRDRDRHGETGTALRVGQAQWDRDEEAGTGMVKQGQTWRDRGSAVRLGQAQWDRHGKIGTGIVGQGQHGETGEVGLQQKHKRQYTSLSILTPEKALNPIGRYRAFQFSQSKYHNSHNPRENPEELSCRFSHNENHCNRTKYSLIPNNDDAIDDLS